MPELDDIARGLAANLAALPGYQIGTELLDNPTPPALQVAGIEAVEYDIAFPKAGVTSDMWLVQIEACLLRNTDLAPQRTLRKLLATTGDRSLKVAVEADSRLTSRYQDDGTILTGQDPACDALHVVRYRGQQHHTLENGTDVLLAVWSVQVWT